MGGAGESAHVDGWFAGVAFGVAEVEGALGRISRRGIEGDALDPLGSPHGSRIQGGQGGTEVVGGEETGAAAWVEDRVVEDKVVEDGLIQSVVIKDGAIEGRVDPRLAIEGRAIPGRSSQSGLSQDGAIRSGMNQNRGTQNLMIQNRVTEGRAFGS